MTKPSDKTQMWLQQYWKAYPADKATVLARAKADLSVEQFKVFKSYVGK